MASVPKAASPDPLVEIPAVVQSLRDAVSQALETVPGRVRRAADLVRLLSLDTKLASQIIRLARSPLPAAAVAADVPGPRSSARFVESIRQYDAPAADRLANQFAAFELLIPRHARSRRAFIALANGLADRVDEAGDAGEAEDERQRREAFRAHRHLLGRASSLLHACYVVMPNSDGTADLAIGYLVDDLHRLRPAQPLHLVRLFQAPSAKVPGKVKPVDIGLRAVEPLDKKHVLRPVGEEPAVASLIPELCSKPIPKVVAEVDSNGDHLHRLAGKQVGAGSAIRITVGQVIRGMKELFSGDPPTLNFRTTLTTPSQRLVMDVILPREMVHAGSPTVRTYLPMLGFGDDSPDQFRQAELFSLGSSLTRLKDEITPHGEVLAKRLLASGSQSVAQEDMSVFRVTVEHPLLAARSAITFSQE